MAKTATRKNPVNVTISTRWQMAFVVAMIGAIVISDGVIIWDFVHISRYVSGGTWAIQSSMWAYPVLYLAAAYVWIQRRVRGALPRLFWATFVAAIGTAVYQIVVALSQLYRQETHFRIHGNSIWDAFGFDWILMAVMLVLYIGTLVYITKRGAHER